MSSRFGALKDTHKLKYAVELRTSGDVNHAYLDSTSSQSGSEASSIKELSLIEEKNINRSSREIQRQESDNNPSPMFAPVPDVPDNHIYPDVGSDRSDHGETFRPIGDMRHQIPLDMLQLPAYRSLHGSVDEVSVSTISDGGNMMLRGIGANNTTLNPTQLSVRYTKEHQNGELSIEQPDRTWDKPKNVDFHGARSMRTVITHALHKPKTENRNDPSSFIYQSENDFPQFNLHPAAIEEDCMFPFWCRLLLVMFIALVVIICLIVYIVYHRESP